MRLPDLYSSLLASFEQVISVIYCLGSTISGRDQFVLASGEARERLSLSYHPSSIIYYAIASFDRCAKTIRAITEQSADEIQCHVTEIRIEDSTVTGQYRLAFGLLSTVTIG